jgi:hypothetical protein
MKESELLGKPIPGHPDIKPIIEKNQGEIPDSPDRISGTRSIL